MAIARPYIPYEIRCIVAARQCSALGLDISFLPNLPLKIRLRGMLAQLFPDKLCHLHHRPALENRTYDSVKKVYIPDANDVDHLVYVETHAHYIETHVHGQGALRSDTAHRMHQRRMDENRGLRSRKPKQKIQSRGFTMTLDPKGTFEGLCLRESSDALPRASRKYWGSSAWPKRKMQSRRKSWV